MKKLLLLIALIGCRESDPVQPEPQEEKKLCLYKRNKLMTDPGCIPNCPPSREFQKCIPHWEVFKYGSDYEIEDCEKCNGSL